MSICLYVYVYMSLYCLYFSIYLYIVSIEKTRWGDLIYATLNQSYAWEESGLTLGGSDLANIQSHNQLTDKAITIINY